MTAMVTPTKTTLISAHDPDTVRGADVIFISSKRLPKRPKKGYLEIAPGVVVEEVSPNENRR